jgi:hypothetical protein
VVTGNGEELTRFGFDKNGRLLLQHVGGTNGIESLGNGLFVRREFDFSNILHIGLRASIGVFKRGLAKRNLS